MKQAPTVFRITTNPIVHGFTPYSMLVRNRERFYFERVFVVGQVRPDASTCRLMKVPISTCNGFHSDVDGRSTILEFHMEAWKVVVLTVFLHSNTLEAFASSMDSIMEQTTLTYSNV